MMENLHVQNYVECARAAGWQVVQEDGFTAVKGPVPEAFANMVWAAAAPESLARARDLFGAHAFTWALAEGQDGALLRTGGFRIPEVVPDMLLDLDRYTSPGHSRRIRISRAGDAEDFPFWTATAGEALRLPGDTVKRFFGPLVEAGAVPLLAFHDGLPAATALAFCGDEAVGIYAVGTRPAYRRLGLGRAVTQACLVLGQEMGQHRALLSASAMGLSLYRRIGFRTERIVSEYRSL